MTSSSPVFRTQEDFCWHELMCAVVEQAVLDWRDLDCGKVTAIMTGDGSVVKKKEVVEFFQSRWFDALVYNTLDFSPEQIRAALKVPKPTRRRRR